MRAKIRRNEKGTVRFGIGIRLIVAFMIPVFFIVALGFISYQKAASGLIEGYESAARETMIATGKYFDLGFHSVETTARQMAADKNIGERAAYGVYNELHKSLIAKAGADEMVKNIHILSVEGIGISSSAGAVNEERIRGFEESEDGKKLLDSKENVIWVGSHPYLDDNLKTYPEDYGISMMYKAGRLAGFVEKLDDIRAYVIMDISTESIKSSLENLDWGDQSLAGFITKDGRVITAEGKEGTEPILSQDFYKEAAASGLTGGAINNCSYGGRRYLFVYARVETVGAMVYALIPQTLIQSQASDIKTVTFALTVVAVLIAVLVGTYIATGIEKVIKIMMDGLSKAAKGDLTMSIQVERNDEFSLLAASINDTICHMRELINDVSLENQQVADSSGEVSEIGSVLAGESEGILKALEEIQSGILRQVEDTESCLGKMSVLSEKVNKVHENTGEIERIAYGTRETAQNGIVMVENLNGKVKETIKATGDVIHNIETLQEKTRDIGSIIDTINDIAEQTNLLSLNASIEAARAGAAGRGFTVVASEVRKLADQSVKASGQIRRIINEIQQNTAVTVKTAQQAGNIAFSEGEALESTVKVFYHINEQVEEVAGTLSKISLEMNDIEGTKDGTLEAMESISAVAEETAVLSEQIDKSAHHQMDAVINLNEKVGVLENSVGEMENAVSVFTIKEEIRDVEQDLKE